MITTARPLPVSQILNNPNADRNVSAWCRDGQAELITNRSWVSLLIIARWIKEEKGRRPVMAVPGFYCYDTIYQIKDEADILYYDIAEDTFLPDYKQLNCMAKGGNIDLFIFVYFFGINLPANDAKIFCKNNNIVLIEDAVHILYPYDKIGKVGDFVLYSPWKNVGLPDGALIEINSNGPSRMDAEYMLESLKKQEDKFEQLPLLRIRGWQGKKIIQKVLPNRRIPYVGVKDDVLSKETPYRVSEYSRNKILNISYTELKQIGDCKRINSLYLREILKQYGTCESINASDVPYALTVKSDDIKSLWNVLSSMGQICYQWPCLGSVSKETDTAITLKKELLHIAVHDGLNPNVIYRRLGKKTDEKAYQQLDMVEIPREEFARLCDEAVKPLPILQSDIYVSAKKNIQGWKPTYIAIKKDDKVISFFAVLSKHGFIYRINRGPYCSNDEYIISVMHLIKKKFGSKGKVLFFAPEMEQSGFNINGLLEEGFKYRRSYFSTGYIDLQLSAEQLRKNLNSKWRNQLKACEKLMPKIKQPRGVKEFERLLYLHILDKEGRNYKDSGDYMTRYLYNEGHMKVLYIDGDDENTIAMVMIALHHKTATYYIGWNNEEGYKINANRFLLWEAIRQLKTEGYEWLDLGGINLIETDGIADFKLGTGCTYKNLVGEYVSV